MPELPEVQSICDQLSPILSGRTVAGLTHYSKKIRRNNLPEQFPSPWTVSSVTRRAKYIVIRGSSHALIVHLGMTGQFLFSPPGSEVGAIPHVVLKILRHRVFKLTGDFGELSFIDPRGFGMVDYIALTELAEYFSDLGPEPFSLSSEEFFRRLQTSRSAIKPALMNQKIIVGLGNIYASEALFSAGIHPEARANTISRSQSALLLSFIIKILSASIASKGTTFSDYRGISGESGNYATNLMVYGRAGLPCYKCNSLISVIKQSGRSTFFCPSCQGK